MLHHTRAVRRGIQNALVVCDLLFMSYQESEAQALHAAGRLVQVGIPVMGHVGLTPQSVHQLGLRQQGKTIAARERIFNEAIALEQAGVFAVVLEHIPADLAQQITEQLKIPTIGIGAGPHCNGQVLVTADMLGLSAKRPPFAKPYLDLRDRVANALQTYAEDVRQHRFPEG